MSDHDGCHVEPVDHRPVDEEDLAQAASALLAVSDMGCPNCAHRVRNALLSVPGVFDADVELSSRMATVAYDGECTSVLALIHAVEHAGEGTRHAYRAVLVS